jgi:hypothetical protein
MPAPLPADWPGIRLLYAQGSTLEELSASSGINLNTLKARSAREGWNVAITEAKESKHADKAMAAVHSGKMQPCATRAVDVHREMLADGAKRTKLGLTRYTARMAEQVAEDGSLEDAPLIKAVADIHAKMHPEESGEGSVSLSFFQIVQARPDEGPVVDI